MKGALSLLAVLGWAAALSQYGEPNMYPLLGGYAALVSAVILGTDATTRSLLVFDRRSVGSGLAVAAVMVAGTHLSFALATALHPEIAADVQGDYAATDIAGNWSVVPMVMMIVIAEELLWRGALMEHLGRTTTQKAALSVALYVAVQVVTGTWVIVALALVCGVLWTAQRLWARSLVSPLVTHLIWTPTVMVIWPVAGS